MRACPVSRVSPLVARCFADLLGAAFVLRPSSDKPKQNSNFLFSQHGSDFEPQYNVRHLDPEQHASRNRYAVGLYDAHVPDVLFAEVLLIPEWTQLTLSAEQIRLNGGVPPPPEPILPTEFTIQLYNPDQQVVVRYRAATFTSAAAWVFELPQQTFREPSASALDRSQHDPVALDLTPKIRFKWKKDGKFNKDMACYVSGKSANPDGSKKKYREPDVTVCIFKGLKEITLYETNLNRLDLEDIKGLEVVLLVGSVVIRDVYFGSMEKTFHLSGSGKKGSATSPSLVAASPSQVIGSGQVQSSPQITVNSNPARDGRVPPTDPRTQWEIDAETSRLKRIAAEEAREQKRKDELEQKRIKKMLEIEAKEQKRHQAELDKETERLKKLYGREDASARPKLPARPVPSPQPLPDRRQYSEPFISPPQQNPASWGAYSSPNLAAGPYMSGAAAASQAGLLNPVVPQPQRLKQKSSFFGFRRSGS